MPIYRIEAVTRPDTATGYGQVERLDTFPPIVAGSESEARRRIVGECQRMRMLVSHFYSVTCEV